MSSAYSQLINRLFSVNLSHGMKLGLENVRNLSRHLNLDLKKLPVIHIAGTNGKGSVAAKIAKGLESKYQKVGLYTSPHISTFRERIQINGEMISSSDVVFSLNRIFSTIDKENLPATFFEITTLLALQYFLKKESDIAVIETGLGGRLDATNIVNPLLTVITSVQLDHTEILGTTLNEIGREKSGIIKPGVPVILGPSALFIPTNSEKIPIMGSFDTVESENKAIARKGLEYLGISEPEIRKAITTKLPCRRECVFNEETSIILDVAHNPSAIERLIQEIGDSKKSYRMICGFSKNKDISSCLRLIRRFTPHIHLVDSPNGRCAPPVLLRDILVKEKASIENIACHESISECIHSVLKLAKKDRQDIIVCGTFFIMSEIRRALGIEEPRDEQDMNERLKLEVNDPR